MFVPSSIFKTFGNWDSRKMQVQGKRRNNSDELVFSKPSRITQQRNNPLFVVETAESFLSHSPLTEKPLPFENI